VDLGMVQSQWGESHQVSIRWQLEENDPKSGKPYMVQMRARLSLHEKSKLRPMLEAWRGKKFSQEELAGFDLEKLIGANCQLQVIHNIADGGAVYANVQAVVPADRKETKLAVRDYVRVKDRDDQPTSSNGHGQDEADQPPF